ncbi:unnamed protein product [Xylocopa violacea]|uniref:KICSTOR complex protein kaptin-like n=1 Tax=Xylocopa violacea TaxID=135666 RepID=A0ABP1PEN0_XYLVO
MRFQVVWLLSGSDYKIHMIREDKLNHSYSESSIEKYFPELHDIQAIAIWINIYYYNNYNWRLTVIGCECGLVIVAITNVSELKIYQSWKLRYDRPISSVSIFSLRNNVAKPSFIKSENSKYFSTDEETKLNVLIVNTSNAVVFMDILNNGMHEDIILNGSETSDCILCSCIADINMDGQNEILLGTYAQEVLIFCFVNDTWELIVRKLFNAPVHSICYMDITNDGMKELIVLTQRGVHILQHNITDVKDKWKKRYTKFLEENKI